MKYSKYVMPVQSTLNICIRKQSIHNGCRYKSCEARFANEEKVTSQNKNTNAVLTKMKQMIQIPQ